MPCKKNNFSNNPVDIDPSEIRLFDGPLINAENHQSKYTFYHSDHVIFVKHIRF